MSAGTVPFAAAGSVACASPSGVVHAVDGLDLLMQRRRGRSPRGNHRMAGLCRELGDPHLEVPTIHVVGTDGKTSIVRIAASLLTALGWSCGETTSPHLQDVTERVRIDGLPVTRSELLSALAAAEVAVERTERSVGEQVTFFEAITGLAFRLFAERKVDAAVVEAGIGGIGDATSVLRSRVAVLSLVGHDHAELGDTLAQVATEKSSVVQPGGLLISAGQRPEVTAAVEKVVADRGARLLLAGRDLGVMTRRPAAGGQDVALRGLDGSYLRGRLPLAGPHQAANAAVALAAVQGFLGTTDLDPDRLRAGLAAVRIPGRVEMARARGGPPVVLDGAHDRDATRALVTTVRESLRPAATTVVLGLSGGRDPRPLLAELASLDARFVVTRASSPTSMPVHDLARRLRRAGVPVTVASDPSAALQTATNLTQPGGCVVVTGSLHLVGEVRGLLAADGDAAAALGTDAVAGAGMVPSGTSAPPLAG